MNDLQPSVKSLVMPSDLFVISLVINHLSFSLVICHWVTSCGASPDSILLLSEEKKKNTRLVGGVCAMVSESLLLFLDVCTVSLQNSFLFLFLFFPDPSSRRLLQGNEREGGKKG